MTNRQNPQRTRKPRPAAQAPGTKPVRKRPARAGAKGVPTKKVKKSLENSRFLQMRDGDQMVDQGVFATLLEGRVIARERFALVRQGKSGFLGRKGGGLSLSGHVLRKDSSLNMDSLWTFDRSFQLSGVYTHSEIGASPHVWDSRFSFKGPQARFRLSNQKSPLDITIPFERGWLVHAGPSVLPLYLVLGRYDMAAGGIQDLTLIDYAADSEDFGLGRNVMELEYLDPIEARDADGNSLILDYFVCDEVPLKGPTREKGDVKRRIHLWADGKRRLRKVIDAQAGVLMTTVREEDKDALDNVQPYPEMIWPAQA